MRSADPTPEDARIALSARLKGFWVGVGDTLERMAAGDLADARAFGRLRFASEHSRGAQRFRHKTYARVTR